jgi:putative N6-adenine-specific DNA methylase
MRIRRIPPGWFRRFAFERWPAFAPRQWAFLRKEAEKSFAEPGTVRILSGDLDRRVLPPLRRRLQAFGLDGAAALYCGDFFHLRPPQARTRSGLVVINPPYGRRLGAKTGGGVDLAPLLGHLKRYWKGWKIAVVAPAGLANTVPFAHRRRAMAHGGLSLVVITARL